MNDALSKPSVTHDSVIDRALNVHSDPSSISALSRSAGSLQSPVTIVQDSLLLKLPPELKNSIYRLAVVAPAIKLYFKGGNRSIVPGLLCTCRGINKDAGSIYVQENRFDVTIQDFNPTLVMFFEEHDPKNVSDFSYFKIVQGQKFSNTGNSHFKCWGGLLLWLREFHAGRAVSMDGEMGSHYGSNGSLSPALLHLVSSFLKTADLGLTWQQTESVVETQKDTFLTLYDCWRRADWTLEQRRR